MDKTLSSVRHLVNTPRLLKEASESDSNIYPYFESARCGAFFPL
jgi:hypothetical protein